MDISVEVGDVIGLAAGMAVFAVLWFLFNYFPAKKRASIFERSRVKYRVLADSVKTALLFGFFYVLINIVTNFIF
ncbi:hypothetical protein [Natranaerofaba carboxydovora]|uniref:hypothetical protein n=1 Tax=Natranaerofaba carboxydovora TaxID=2742683 RepID=UPI001F13CB86|nr:hypothetical protein [Natranaerofaba carboxydovora]UMZ74911.1 hypothetical protein ACONDI_02515 [Natranaerofaba carboxydovora]